MVQSVSDEVVEKIVREILKTRSSIECPLSSSFLSFRSTIIPVPISMSSKDAVSSSRNIQLDAVARP